MLLSKFHVAQLLEAPIDVRLMNGCFNVATVVVQPQSVRHKIELRVEVTHPLLAWQCGSHQAVELIYFKGNCGAHIEVPPELSELVERMRVAATMSNEEAAKLSEENARAFHHGMTEMGLST